MIDGENVRLALRSSLGDVLTRDAALTEGAAGLLRSFGAWREDYADLARSMEEYLFNAIYERVGPGMTFPLGDGTFRRLMMADLPALADAALFPFFDALSVTEEHFIRLHAYWMNAGSLSALRALYLNFRPLLPPREASLIERIVRENIPPAQQNEWFRGKDESSP